MYLIFLNLPHTRKQCFLFFIFHFQVNVACLAEVVVVWWWFGATSRGRRTCPPRHQQRELRLNVWKEQQPRSGRRKTSSSSRHGWKGRWFSDLISGLMQNLRLHFLFRFYTSCSDPDNPSEVLTSSSWGENQELLEGFHKKEEWILFLFLMCRNDLCCDSYLLHMASFRFHPQNALITNPDWSRRPRRE